jgi:hypothetical protein
MVNVYPLKGYAGRQHKDLPAVVAHAKSHPYQSMRHGRSGDLEVVQCNECNGATIAIVDSRHNRYGLFETAHG